MVNGEKFVEPPVDVLRISLDFSLKLWYNYYSK